MTDEATFATPEPAGFTIHGDPAPLFAALAKARGAFGELVRTRTVEVRMSAGGSYRFDYAPLEEILAACTPALSANELVLFQPLSKGPDGTILRTILAHASGAYLECCYPIPPAQDIKALGSAVTYMRRYTVQALLGVAAEADDDAGEATGDHTQIVRDKSKPPAPAPKAAKPKPEPKPEPAPVPAAVPAVPSNGAPVQAVAPDPDTADDVLETGAEHKALILLLARAFGIERNPAKAVLVRDACGRLPEPGKDEPFFTRADLRRIHHALAIRLNDPTVEYQG